MFSFMFVSLVTPVGLSGRHEVIIDHSKTLCQHYFVVIIQESVNMMYLDEIRAMLADRRLSLVAEATGLHYNTIRIIRDDPNANPTYKAVKALSDYLQEGQKKSNG